VQNAARENLRHAKERSKIYDKRINPHNFKINERTIFIKRTYSEPREPIYRQLRISDKANRIVHMDKLRLSPTIRPEENYITDHRRRSPAVRFQTASMLPIILLTVLPYATGLHGYDCGGDRLNITTISLLDIGDCSMQDEPDTNPTKDSYIQLMQLADYDKTRLFNAR